MAVIRKQTLCISMRESSKCNSYLVFSVDELCQHFIINLLMQMKIGFPKETNNYNRNNKIFKVIPHRHFTDFAHGI